MIGRLRLVGFLEGLSFLLLLGVAMPMKYMLDLPQAVRVIGMLHGILFILYVALSILATYHYRWTIRTMLLLCLASVLPFGTFYADTKLLRNREEID